MILITHNNATFQQGDELETVFPEYYFSTKEPQKKGHWYFEIEHNSGTNSYICGFKSSNNDEIGFFPELNISNPRIWLDPSFRYNQTEPRVFTNFKLEQPYIVGVSLDIDHSTITAYYESERCSFVYPKQDKTSKYRFFCTGGNIFNIDSTGTYMEDTVKVNFGDLPFKYNIKNVIPWNKDLPLETCYVRNPFLFNAGHIALITIGYLK